MKKLFALLLAMMMPLCALADAYSLSLSFDTDDILFPQYLKEALLQQPDTIPADEADGIIKLLQHLMDGLAVEMVIQEDAAALNVQVAGSDLADLVVYATENYAYLTSTLIPGYALVEDTQSAAADEQVLSSAMESADWTSVAVSIEDSFNAWFADVEPTVSTGSFSGDSYEGGTFCTTWTLTDSDIVALVSTLTTKEFRQTLSSIYDAMGVEVSSIFEQFDAKNAAVADADTYTYIIRVVEDDAGELRGISLTIFEDIEQVATVSLGFAEKEIQLVIGLGFPEQNYWWQMTARKNQRNNLTFLGGTSQEWMADKLQSFSYVKAANAPLTDYEWQCIITKSGNRYLWDASIYENNDQSDYAYLASSSGSVSPTAKMLNCSLSLGGSPYIPITLKLNFSPTEEITPLDPALKLCNVSSDADAKLSQELSDKFAAALMARLIKLLPLDVIMMLNQFTLPQ